MVNWWGGLSFLIIFLILFFSLNHDYWNSEAVSLRGFRKLKFQIWSSQKQRNIFCRCLWFCFNSIRYYVAKWTSYRYLRYCTNKEYHWHDRMLEKKLRIDVIFKKVSHDIYTKKRYRPISIRRKNITRYRNVKSIAWYRKNDKISPDIDTKKKYYTISIPRKNI